jgi:hypothetical protein
MAKDFLNGDHSFKNWFNIMWKNGYIFFFLLFFGLFIGELVNLNWTLDLVIYSWDDGIGAGIATLIAVLIPPGCTIMIAYKAFYQYWQDLKGGRSR